MDRESRQRIADEAAHASLASLRGDRALAVGALAAGVGVVCGYPGAPATGVFDALLTMTTAEQVDAHWAPNEKVALEVAFGASLGGMRSLVVLKSVGLNIALDPLATMSLSGCHAGMVILLGDDPGGWSSQNEQDSRWLARVAEVPVIEPCNVRQAAALMAQAFAWSEALGVPVIVRVTGAFAAAQDALDPPWQLPPAVPGFVRRRNRWVVLPTSVVAQHRSLHRHLRQMQQVLEASPYEVSAGAGSLWVIAVGYTHAKVSQVLGDAVTRYRILGLSSVWPLPERRLLRWLRPLQRVLVIEEGGPFVEEALRALAQRAGLTLAMLGRHDRVLPEEGELSLADIARAVARLDVACPPMMAAELERTVPSKVPLCADCPYRPTFEALLAAMERHGGRQQHIVIGETGCMVRANLPPFDLFDVKYALGSGLGLGLGLALAGLDQRIVALLGDSSFFHSDLNALPYAVQRNCTMVVVILDNGATALTGGQPHPGSARDARGQAQQAADLVNVVRGCGVEPTVCAAGDPSGMIAAFDRALSTEGLQVLIVRGPCPKYAEREG